MTTRPRAPKTADEFMDALVAACAAARLCTQIVERSTKIRINAPGISSRMAEVVTLKPDENEVLAWWWSWGDRICAAGDATLAAEMIRTVVSENA